MFGVFLRLLHVLIIAALPLLVLVRGAVHLHQYFGFFPLAAILTGALICTLILFIYLNFFINKISSGTENIISWTIRIKVLFVIVALFCMHALFFIRTNNLKQPDLKKDVSALHPIIRLAVSTIIVFDKELIVTDAKRVPEDYRRMGLPTNRTSLHYVQKDGYAYAIDIRTHGRSGIRNFLVISYFRLMGLRTMRHSGSGDHMHISLYCPYLPRSI